MFTLLFAYWEPASYGASIFSSAYLKSADPSALTGLISVFHVFLVD